LLEVYPPEEEEEEEEEKKKENACTVRPRQRTTWTRCR
jgi:hypothetical protein